MKRLLTLLCLLLINPALAQDTVTVASKNFAESQVLGELMAQMIEAHTDLKVVRRLGLGGSKFCFEATVAGQVDCFPGYTGTGAITILKLEGEHRDPLRTYLEVKEGYEEGYGLTWLTPLGFNNTYILAVRPETAKELGLEKISDLKGVENQIKPGVSHEFLNRPDGFPGLKKAYGLNFPDATGVDHGLAYQAIANGKIDLIDAYSTDGELLRYNLEPLRDDKRFFPPYDAAPVIRLDVIRKHPEMKEALDRLGYQIDEETMQNLNYQVQEEKRPIPQVVSEFLRSKNLISEDQVVSTKAAGGDRSKGFVGFMLSRMGKTFSLTKRHLYLTVASLALAIGLGVPVGIFITRTPALAQPILGVAGVIQTIPSIALLAFMIPIPGLGLGVRSAIAALFLYALLPIIRNTYTGIKEVDGGLLEAARGMGLTDRQLLTIVELPLATRTIMAGVRTSAVINVGVATLAAFIGAGGLGDPIVTGLQLNDTNLILAGAIPAALLAIVVDQALGLVEKLLAPKGMAT